MRWSVADVLRRLCYVGQRHNVDPAGAGRRTRRGGPAPAVAARDGPVRRGRGGRRRLPRRVGGSRANPGRGTMSGLTHIPDEESEREAAEVEAALAGRGIGSSREVRERGLLRAARTWRSSTAGTTRPSRSCSRSSGTGRGRRGRSRAGPGSPTAPRDPRGAVGRHGRDRGGRPDPGGGMSHRRGRGGRRRGRARPRGGCPIAGGADEGALKHTSELHRAHTMGYF